MCVYVCVCVWIYICMFMYISIYKNIYKLIYKYSWLMTSQRLAFTKFVRSDEYTLPIYSNEC